MKRSDCFSIAIAIAFLTLLSFPRAGFSQDLSKGLVGYWSFCNCSLKDQTGNGHDGTLVSAPSCVAGKMDQAYQFDGSNSIDVPYSDAFDIDPDSELTLAAWIKPSRVDVGYQALVVKGTDFWDYGLYIDISGAFMFGCNWPNHETFSTTLPHAEVWYHVVGVYSNRDWKLYVNGKLENEEPNGVGLNRSTNPIGFGIKGNFFKDMYAGTIDEVRLYNRALSDSEVMALYLWKGVGVLSLSSNATLFVEHNCTPVDTSIQFWTGGCGSSSFSLDSVWLSGSSAFGIIGASNVPRQVFSIDSIVMEYSPTLSAADTAQLHIRYDLGSGMLDTNIQIVATLGSQLFSSPVRLHREVGVSYFDNQDSLPLGVDINSSVNLDSLWPYLHDISGTYSFDSSVVGFSGYMPPTGWVLNSLLNHRNSVDFGIHNQSSKTPSQPMDLGTAVFMPTHSKLETSDVSLTNFMLGIGNQSLTPCVTEDEDQHWSVKVLVTDGVAASYGVSQTPFGIQSIMPNPAMGAVQINFINPLSPPISYEIIDALGVIRLRGVTSGDVLTLDVSPFAEGVYFFRATSANRISVASKLVIIR